MQHLDMSIEFTSDDETVGPGHIMVECSRTFIDAGERRGKTFKIADNAGRYIREAGFEDVHEQWYNVPVGRWPKDKIRHLY